MKVRPEPTDDDRAKAIVAMSQAIESDRLTVGHAIRLVAQLLADQRAAIHASYEAVAKEWSHAANLVNPDGPMADMVYSATLNDCARDVRQVALK